MQSLHASPRLRKLGLAVGIFSISLLFTGCAKKVTPTSETSNSYTNSVTTETQTNSGAPSNAYASPMGKANTTDEAVSNEGTALNKLNQNAGSVDQSLNDKPINVQ